MSHSSSRRQFVRSASCLFAAAHAGQWPSLAAAADAEPVIVDTAAGKVRGFLNQDIKTFKGIPYGASTAGKNRFMPPVKMPAWTGTRDASAFGPSGLQAALPEGSPPAAKTVWC
jgi:para-nitrobenzyl esterase